jgi:membrane associated rhomboid family serine protease
MAATPVETHPLAGAHQAADPGEPARRGVVGPVFRPWATRAILASLVLVFALEAVTGPTTSTVTLWHLGANDAASVRAGQVWRLLSSAFLHFGPLHLLFNALALNAFGPLLEMVLGRARFLLLYALAALGGGLGSFAAAADGRVSAGASGALWGLMAAEFALGFAGGELLPEELRRGLRRAGLRLLGLNVLISLLPGIDLAAHLGGGVVGALLVVSRLLTRGRRAEILRRDARGGRAVTAAAALAWTVVLGALVTGIVAGRPWDVRRPPEHWRVTMLPGSGFSVELPPTFELRRVPARSPDARAYVAGHPFLHPLAASIHLLPAPGGDPAQYAAAMLEEARRALRPRGEGVRNAWPVTLAGRPFVALTYAGRDGRTRLAWAGLVDGAGARVDVYVRDDAAPEWRAAAARFASSLRRAPSRE